MNEKKRKSDIVLEYIISKGTATVEDICNDLGIDKKLAKNYCYSLKNQNKIKPINPSVIPYTYRAITPLALLKTLYNIMINKMEPTEALSEDEENIIDTIEANYFE